MQIMLIDAQQATPPPQQLGGPQSQPMVSSPSPQSGYNMIERLKIRVAKYRYHHQISYQKNQNTIEAQNIKMKTETNRLQQQYLNNAHSNTTNAKSKQQKSLSTTGASRTNNKRSNSSSNNTSNSNSNNNSSSNTSNNSSNSNNNSNTNCDGTEPKANKLPKLAAATARTTANNTNSVKVSELSPTSSYRNTNNKFNSNSPLNNQIDIKMKPSIVSSCISTTASQPLIPNNLVTSAPPEIKREVVDNSYFESVTVEAIRDFLASTDNNNSSAPNGVEGLGPDIWKDFLNDASFADDGLASANFGDEDFITKFLEDINGPTFNDFAPQQINNTQFKQVINHSNNMVNNTNLINQNNSNTTGVNTNNMIVNSSQLSFNRNQFQTHNNDIASYHPIQPRLQPNLVTNIPNRSSVQILNSNTHPNFIPNVVTVNNNNIRNYAPNTIPQQQQQGLLQTAAPLPQQPMNNIQLQQQSQASQLMLQQQTSQPVHLRIPTTAVQQMGVVSVIPKTENNLSVQLSIQVPQQQQQQQQLQQASQVPPNTQSSQQSANASIKLKQMAQQVQQKNTHQWVINHSNIPLTQTALQPQQQIQQQPIAQQRPPQQLQRLPQQIQQQRQPQPIAQQQNQIQLQHQTQQQYFTPQVAQNVYWQQQQQPQPQPQQQQPQQGLQQNQQNFQTYWSQHPQQVMPQSLQHQQQQQPQQQQQSQHYYNNSYNYF